MSNLGKSRSNIFLGVSASIWNVLIGLAFVPIYLRVLGLEAYGVIGFFVSYQTALLVLDLGLAAAVSREIARLLALNEGYRIRSLVATLGAIYWGVAIFIALMTVMLSSFFAFYWLQSRSISPEVVLNAAVIMGFATAVRWPTNLYAGMLQGFARSGQSNALLAGFSTLSSVMSVVTILFVSPTLPAFFLAQGVVAVIQVFVFRVIAFRHAPAGETRLDWTWLRTIRKFAAGMTLLSLSGVVFLQLDKFILARLLSLSELGVYILASTIAASLYRLTIPVYQAFVPHLSALAATGDYGKLKNLHGRGTYVLTTVLAAAALGLILVGQPLIAFWTQNSHIADQASPILSIIVIGVVMDGAMTFPAAIQLAHGATRMAVIANLWSLAIYVPITVVLALRYGAMGGAFAWLTLHSFHFLLAAFVMHRQLMPNYFSRWLLHDFGLPVGSMAVAGIAGMMVIHAAKSNAVGHIATASVFCIGGMFLAMLVSRYRSNEMLGLRT